MHRGAMRSDTQWRRSSHRLDERVRRKEPVCEARAPLCCGFIQTPPDLKIDDNRCASAPLRNGVHATRHPGRRAVQPTLRCSFADEDGHEPEASRRDLSESSYTRTSAAAGAGSSAALADAPSSWLR